MFIFSLENSKTKKEMKIIKTFSPKKFIACYEKLFRSSISRTFCPPLPFPPPLPHISSGKLCAAFTSKHIRDGDHSRLSWILTQCLAKCTQSVATELEREWSGASQMGKMKTRNGINIQFATKLKLKWVYSGVKIVSGGWHVVWYHGRHQAYYPTASEEEYG